MGDRKVINKYIPPDFDPSQITRPRKDKRKRDEAIKSRMMLPITVCCKTCGGYIYKGTKFNARKETVKGEDYLGIRIFRFYFRCPACAAELTIKTDPKNSDYTVEHGATRNFEPRKHVEREEEAARAEREQEEEGDKMRALENKTKQSKREMELLEALDEMTHLRRRQEMAGPEAALRALHAAEYAKEPEGDTELEAVGGVGGSEGAGGSGGGADAGAQAAASLAAEADAQLTALEAGGAGGFVRRVADGPEDDARGGTTSGGASGAAGFAAGIGGGFGGGLGAGAPVAPKPKPRFAVRAKPAAATAAAAAAAPAPPPAAPAAALGMLGGYSSSSDDE